LVSHIEVGIYAENRVLTEISGPNMDKITGEWRRQHDVELYNLCSSPTIIWVIEGACGTYGGQKKYIQDKMGRVIQSITQQLLVGGI
jgi:hypothetical protein